MKIEVLDVVMSGIAGLCIAVSGTKLRRKERDAALEK